MRAPITIVVVALAAACKPVPVSSWPERTHPRARTPRKTGPSPKDLFLEKFPPFLKQPEASATSEVDEFTFRERHYVELFDHQESDGRMASRWNAYFASTCNPDSGEIKFTIQLAVNEFSTDGKATGSRGLPNLIEIAANEASDRAIRLEPIGISDNLSDAKGSVFYVINFDADKAIDSIEDFLRVGAKLRVSSKACTEVYRTKPSTWTALLESMRSTPITAERLPSYLPPNDR